MDTDRRQDGEAFKLTPEYRMLLQMRDTLYEGSWADFVEDLQARAAGRPHVFQTIPDTPGMRATIAVHLNMIEEMKAWEAAHQCRLSGDEAGDS